MFYTWYALKDIDHNLQFNEEKTAVLVLRYPGFGPSKLLQFLTSADDGFIVNETSEEIMFPGIVTDRETNTTFYDCPGFGNSRRNTTADITLNYFMKKIIDNVRHVKLLFDVDYSVFQLTTEGKQLFVDILEHATTMMKGMDRFEHGVGLIVTQNDGAKTIGKNKILDYFANLKQMSDLNVSSKTEAFKLIDILSVKENIRIYRHSRHKDIEWIKNMKNNIKKNINRQLNFVPAISEHFHCVLTETSKSYVETVIARIIIDIKTKLNMIKIQFQNHYATMQKKEESIYDLCSTLNQEFEQSRWILTTIVTRNNLQIYFHRLGVFLETLNISSIHLQDIINGIGQLQMLRFIKENNTFIDEESIEWIEPFVFIPILLSGSKDWCEFLLSTHHELSESIQLNKTYKFNYNKFVQRINDVKNNNDKDLKGYQLKGIFQTIYDEKKLIGYEELEHLDIDESRWMMMINMIKSAYTNEQSFECDFRLKQLTIQGEYIRLRDLQWKNCPGGVRSIKILARKKILVDVDLTLDSHQLRVALIAPHLSIIGRRKILLNNMENGTDPNAMESVDDQKQFFVIAQVYHNLHNLEIDAESSSKIATLLTLDDSKTCHDRNKIFNTLKYIKRYQLGVINEYKKYLIQSIRSRTYDQTIKEMLESLMADHCVQILYDEWGYIDELNNLEELSQLENMINLVPFYRSILKRIDANLNDMKNQKIAVHAYTLAWSKMWNLKSTNDNNLIIDMEGYLDEVLRRIPTLHGAEKILSMNENYNAYKNTTDTEMKTSYSNFKRYVEPKINEIGKKLTNEITFLLNSLDTLKGDIAHNEELKVSHEKSLKVITGAKLVSNVVVAVGFVLMSLNCIGLIIGGVFVVGGSAVGIVLNEFGPSSLEIKDVKKETTDTLINIGQNLLKVREKKLQVLNRQIETLRNASQNYRDNLSDVLETLCRIKDGAVGNATVNDIDTSVVHKTLTEAIESYEANDADDTIQGMINLLKKTRSIPTVSGITDSMDLIKANYERTIETIANEDMERIQLYRDSIFGLTQQAFDATKNYMDNAVKSMKNKSGINIAKWSIRGKIQDIKRYMRSLTDGLETQPHLLDCWDEMDMLLDQTIRTYNRMQKLAEESELSNYINYINSVGVDDSMTNDRELDELLIRTKRNIQYNIFQKQYDRLIGSWRQSTFPFVNFYSTFVRLPRGMEHVDNGVTTLTRKIQNLKAKLVESRVSIVRGSDFYLRLSTFSSRDRLNDPFYVWKNQQHYQAIEQLLQGKEIILNANIMRINAKNAVKFNRIELLFNIKNQTVQNQFYSILDKFAIFMRHTGASNYRCGYKIYTISSSEQIIYQSFAKDENGIPERRNQIYEKLEGIDPVLSPYTVWMFRLEKIDDVDYKELSNYKGLVDLELAGSGSYVIDNSRVCDEQLGRYYALNPSPFGITNLYDELSFQINNNDLGNPSSVIDRQRRMIHQDFRYHQNNRSSGIILGNNYSYNTNNTLLLMQYAIRKITGSKLGELNFQEKQSNYDKVFIRSTNIALKFSKEVKDLCKKHDISMSKLLFDPVSLSRELKTNMLNGSYEKFHDIFYNSVTPYNLTVEFQKDLNSVINKFLKFI